MKPKADISIQFQGRTFGSQPSESVLDTLLRHNQIIPWSCRAGLCHACLVQVVSGDIPKQSQQGLTPEQKTDNLLLACQCYPEDSLELQIFERSHQPMQAIITHMRALSPTLMEVSFSPQFPFAYESGQHLLLGCKKSEISDHYAILSCRHEEADLRVHVARKAGHPFSSWLFEEAQPGTHIWLHWLQVQSQEQ